MSARPLCCSLALATALGLAGGVPVAGVSRAGTAIVPPQDQAGALDLAFDQGKRHFDAFQYDEAMPVFDRLIAALTPGGQVQRPELLVQAYELRARARFALGNATGAEQDFSALLALQPDFKLAPNVSPRVVAIFEAVRKLTIGQASISMLPAGDFQIGARTFTAATDPMVIDLPIGEHELTATRPGFAPAAQRFTVAAGEPVPVSVRLERVSATLTVVTIPSGVEVLLDGTARGKTSGGDAAGSSPLLLADLPLGAHKLLLRRECYLPEERTITLAAQDLRTDPISLTHAVATVKVETTETAAAVFVDGESRGLAPADLTLCEGEHVVEVRTPKGRFVDRRDWKTGDEVALEAEIRSAFPLAAETVPAGVSDEQLRANVERALGKSQGLMIYAPVAAELQAAMREENVPADFLNLALREGPASTRVPKAALRDAVRKLATRLGVQGISAIAAGTDPYQVSVWLLAAGSGEPDVIAVNLGDPASQARAVDLLSARLPPVLRLSLDAATVDLLGVQGATVIRAGAATAKAGLAPGDTIVGAGGKPVTSVADLRAIVAAMPASGPATIALDVKGTVGAQRTMNAVLTPAAASIPLRDSAILYNKAVLDLQERVTGAANATERSAAQLNLAIALMRLGNWDDALAALKDVHLPESAGVSAGTLSYLSGLAHEGAGRAAEAQAAFTKAAAATQARLGADGPLIAPLAQAKIRR